MATTRRAAHFENRAEWDAIWDDYDARSTASRPVGRQVAGATSESETSGTGAAGIVARRPYPRRDRPHNPAPRAVRRAPRRAWGIRRTVVTAVLATTILVALWAVLPWFVAARVTAGLRGGDGAAVARQVEPTAAIAGLREALLAEVPPGMDGNAGRWLADLAGRMVVAAEARGTASEWVRLRAGVRDNDAFGRLEVLRDVRTIGPALFRLEYGPERGAGGMRFDVAWGGGDFRVVALRTLDAPPRELPRLRPSGTVVAMR